MLTHFLEHFPLITNHRFLHSWLYYIKTGSNKTNSRSVWPLRDGSLRWKSMTEISKNLNNQLTLELSRNRGWWTRVCFPFSALTQIQATLKNLKTIIRLVKSADCISYHSAVPHRETEWWGWRWRGSERSMGKGGIMDEVSCEKERNWEQKFRTPSCVDISITASSPCHSCECVWFHGHKGILTKWCNSERSFVHLKLPSWLSDTPLFACNKRLGIDRPEDRPSPPIVSSTRTHLTSIKRGHAHEDNINRPLV